MFFRGQFEFLSNMYPCKVLHCINGREFQFSCSEAAFQAEKCPDRVEEFLKINGYQAKKLGKKVRLRSDWDNIKISVMETVVREKFSQNPELLQKLQQLSDPIIEHNSWNDKFWGVCDNEGENHLGKILMKIQEENHG